jgi:protein translocase SecG subunit
MSVLEIIGGILIILLCVGIISMVLLQKGTRGGGISALTGGNNYFDKNQDRSGEALLFKATKYAAIALFLLTIIVYVVNARG